MPYDFEKAFARLASLTNWEGRKPPRGHRFDLDGIAGLCRRLGRPELALRRVVQVGGSKGKGTVASLLAGAARRVGLSTGTYLSPHVQDLTERIQLDGRPVPRGDLAPQVARVAAALVEGQTWFEAWTATALATFAARRPDLTILEVGVGGRLDATTIVPKQACAVTNVELEHTHLLGDSLEAVAAEKAGILRPRVPCVTAAEDPALAVVARQARALGAPLRVLGPDFGWDSLERTAVGFAGRLRLPGGRAFELEVPLRTRPAVQSLALSLALLHELVPERVRALLAAGDFSWVPRALPPARFQVLAEDPPIVVDGAHTDGSLSALAADLAAVFPGVDFHLVFAVARRKRYEAGLRALLPLVDRCYAAPLAERSSEDPRRIAALARAEGVEAQVCDSVARAVREARAGCGGLLVAGSFYGAGEALAVLRPAGAADGDREGVVGYGSNRGAGGGPPPDRRVPDQGAHRGQGDTALQDAGPL